MTKARKNPSPKKVGAPAKQNLKFAEQRRKALRTHYAAKYLTR